ncbi:hypothetical protein CBM2606_A140384 [Cupriavidus taiwanensis]|nr:hypothetical protein CBM2606_A140384 [Cupriavidus taiwanensis]
MPFFLASPNVEASLPWMEQGRPLTSKATTATLPITHQGPPGIHTMPSGQGLKQEFSWISLSSRS